MQFKKTILLGKIKSAWFPTDQSKYIFLLIFVISLLALVLRVWGISNKEFWYDEAYTGILANLPFNQFTQVFKYDVHPPLYITILRSWILIFGNSDLAIRMFSVFSGVLLIPASYFLASGLNIAKKRPSIKFIVPLIFAVNPFFVEYAKEARDYSLTALMFSVLFIFYYSTSKTRHLNLKWVATSLIIVATFLTHYLTIIGIIFLFLFDLFFANKKSLAKTLLIYLTTIGIFSGFMVLYLPTLLTQYQNAPLLGWIPISQPQRLATTIYIFLFGVKTNSLGVPPALKLSPYIQPEALGFIILTIFSLSLGYYFGKKYQLFRKDLILLSFISILPILTVMGLQIFNKRLFLERYLTPYAVVFIVLCITLSLNLKRIYKYSFLTLYIFTSLYLITTIHYESTGFAQLTEKLQVLNTPNVQLIVSNPIEFVVAKYYLASKPNIKVRIYNPKENYDSWEVIQKSEVMKNYSELDGKQRIFVYDNSKKPDIWYRQSVNIGKLYVYSTLPIFDTSLAFKK
ncbi:glycosyltransferase family 39 protein [Patescibacteria group bacterium]|nr:glycosyltransferase family 39 protein [Patescibacteria group bacterium]